MISVVVSVNDCYSLSSDEDNVEDGDISEIKINGKPIKEGLNKRSKTVDSILGI